MCSLKLSCRDQSFNSERVNATRNVIIEDDARRYENEMIAASNERVPAYVPEFKEADEMQEECVPGRINATERLLSALSSPSIEVPHKPYAHDFVFFDEQP